MMRPLYQAAATEPESLPEGAHTGLWFDKFCHKWKSESYPEVDKPAWIGTVTRVPVGKPQQIREHARRQVRMLRRSGGRFAVFKAESPFVTGLGRSHPIENGFAWHPTLGTPYLPGSSIKGLVKAWVKQQAETQIGPITRVFGTPGQVGGICFVDAVPIEPVRLNADVMTPHYGGWTRGNPPGDWRSPTPIPFLVTAKSTALLFGFAPCGPQCSNDLDDVFKLLRNALAWAGAGAKTAVGYGRFRHDEEQTGLLEQQIQEEQEKRRKKQQRKQLEKTPEGRWHLEVEDRSETEVLELVRIHLEKERLDDSHERQAFAHAVSTLHPDFVKNWRRGERCDPATMIGAKKLKERARLLKQELPETGAKN